MNGLLAQRSTKEVQVMQAGLGLQPPYPHLPAERGARGVFLRPADPSPTSAKQRRAASATRGAAPGPADQCKVLLVFLLPQPRAVRPPHAEHQSDGREKKGPALPTATKQSKTQTQS